LAFSVYLIIQLHFFQKELKLGRFRLDDVRLFFQTKTSMYLDFYQLLKVVCILGYIPSFCVVFVKKCGVWNFSWLKTDLTSFDIVIPYMFSSYPFLERVKVLSG